MNQIKLTRTNKRPVVFDGEEILTCSTRDHNSTRWQKLSIFRTANKIVAGLGNITCWQGEHDYYSVEIFTTNDDLMSWVEEHCPALAEEVAAGLNVAEVI